MAERILEYGKTYEIPVVFECEEISTRMLQGVIHVKERTSYLEITICNDGELLEFTDEKEIKIDLIRCFPRRGGRHMLLVGNNFKTRPIRFGGHTTEYRAYFQYIINGASGIDSLDDLNFKTVEFRFENFDTWVRPYLSLDDKVHQSLFEHSNIKGLGAKIEFQTTQTCDDSVYPNKRTIQVTYDTRVVLTKRRGGFNLKKITELMVEFEALFSCMMTASCYCTRVHGIKPKRSPVPHKEYFGLLNPWHITDPTFELGFSGDALIPFPLHERSGMNLGSVFDEYFSSKKSFRSTIRRAAAVFLHRKKFLYDILFGFVANLLPSLHDQILGASFKGKPKFREQFLDSVPSLSETQLNSICNVTLRFRKGKPENTYKDKLLALIDFQFPDCQLVHISEDELKFIYENRNKLSHGSSIKYDKNIREQDVLQKMLILLLISIFQRIGIDEPSLRQSITMSMSKYLYALETGALQFHDAEKIYVPHEHFEEIKQSSIKIEGAECCVVEKYQKNYRVNLAYTAFFRKDHWSISKLHTTTDIIRCYYRPREFRDIVYQGNTYIVDKTTEERIGPTPIALVELHIPVEQIAYIRTDALIPLAVQQMALTQKIPVLKAYRQHKNYSIKELAIKSRLSTSTIVSYESTRHPARKETYLKILKALGTDLSRISKRLRD